MIKDIFFYNLCSEGQSLRMIKKVIECDITLEKIKTI